MGLGVGIVYDPRMCAHEDPYNQHHPEQPARITAIWESLENAGVLERCVRVEAREATVEELAAVHTEKHIATMCSASSRSYDKARRAALARRYNSIYFNEGSSMSALLAAGSVIELSARVARGELSSGAAIVRPPGHHAEADEAMGFCLFNNVAIAAQIIAHRKPGAASQKVLIVDWDVHHGNGTQHMFWNDPNILYFSVHRYDDRTFYPAGEEGNYDKVGEGAGAGFNVNVPWPHGGYGDGDYLAVWDYILMPVAKEFNPDVVLISGGFDSAQGDPLGGCNITPLGYSIMTQKLMELAGGKIVLALEGGYNLESISRSYLACVQTLLGGLSTEPYTIEQAFESTWSLIEKVREELSRYWPVLCGKIDKSVSKRADKEIVQIESSDEEDMLETIGDFEEAWASKQVYETVTETPDHQELVELLEKLTTKPESISSASTATVQAADDAEGKLVERKIFNADGLSMDFKILKRPHLEAPVDLKLKTTYVWYACYGSNMWQPRLMCYIQGGKVEGMKRMSSGSRDETPPVEDFWLSVPHRLFFGRIGTLTWGSGGVAFLDTVPSEGEYSSHLRAYKITLEQFNDLLVGENRLGTAKYNLVSLEDIDLLLKRPPPHTLDIIQGAWYGSVLYLGEKDGLPILTITCSTADVESYKAGRLPVCPPSAAYRDVITKGLIEKGDMSEDDAIEYVALRSIL